MKIALYNRYENTGPEEVNDWRETSDSYTRLTEIIDIDWQMLPAEVVVPKQFASLDAAEAELRNRFNEKLSELQTKRANLLSLTHQVQP